MRHASDASSSDLERARELSRKLRPGPRTGEAAARPAGEGGFVRFRAAGMAAGPGPGAGTVPRPVGAVDALRPAVQPATPSAGTLWDPFLDWCRAVAGAASGFVLDGQGLIVAVRGPLSPTEAEGIGARVMVALEQARKIPSEGSNDPTVGIDFGESCLSGFGVVLADRSPLTIGLIGPRFVGAEARRTIARAFEAR